MMNIMNRKWSVFNSFNEYRNETEKILRIISSAHPEGALDDQGVPAYLTGLNWSRSIFWKRLKTSTQSISEKPGGKCIDFGCGTGILLPFLNPLFDTVYAIDIHLNSAREFIALWNHSGQQPLSNIHLFDTLEDINALENSIDLIIALDSLEHVDNLDKILLKMKYLLKPEGRLLISGPTENLFYRLGRTIVGFSGNYHLRSIYDIKKIVKKHFQIRSIKRIGLPFVLFLLIDAEKR
jgi:2-polyprenyl-3-methyl-5-hydroxy-6-metoxy-1,4-benzoquinol methylase